MKIPYTVKKSRRARAMRVSVYPDGAVVVTVPSGREGSTSVIRSFVEKCRSWILGQIRQTAGRVPIYVNKADIPMLKKRALALASARSAHFAAIYGVSHGTITIRAQKSRWGSCSHKGDLSFNYKMAALPPHLADYVVVHEICHLLALDHSKRFWDLVERTIPDHRALRKELRSIIFLFR